MGNRALTLLAKAKAHFEFEADDVHQHPSWPPHNILCGCTKCMKQEFRYIKEMRREARQAKQKAQRRRVAQ